VSGPPGTPRPAPDATAVFGAMLGRLRAVEHFAVGRRVLAIVALGRLSQAPIRQVLFGHAHAPDPTNDGHNQVRRLLLDAAAQVEAEDPGLAGVFTEVLVPDAFQTRFLAQNALFAAELLSRLPPPALPQEFGFWFSDRLDQIVLAGPAATEVGTPRPIAELMVGLAQVRAGDRVYDPCCGLGALLSHAGLRAPDLLLRGTELHPVSWALSTLRLRLLGLDSRVERGDALRTQDVEPADRVICDPPLGNYITAASELRIEVGRTGAGHTRRLDSLFLEKSWHALSAEGRAVVLVSQPTLFRRGPEQELRSRLIASRALDAVIALPPGAVAWTNAEMALIILDRAKVHDRVRFIDAVQFRTGRTVFAPSRILAAYANPEDGPGTRWVPVEALSDDNSLVPRRHIHVETERPAAAELFGRSERLMEQANDRAARIYTLLKRLVVRPPKGEA
jgi:hypothetical protein